MAGRKVEDDHGSGRSTWFLGGGLSQFLGASLLSTPRTPGDNSHYVVSILCLRPLVCLKLTVPSSGLKDLS